MLEGGATTLWEHWEFSDNTYSHNHPMFGTVSEWFFKALGGIEPGSDAVGFNRIVIAPNTPASLEWVRVSYDSVRGRIESEWRRNGNRLELDVRIPVGATARVILPGITENSIITESGESVAKAKGVTRLGMENGRVTFEVASGEYHFAVNDW
jgi:alpha-L-rhamnosidase